MDLRIRVRGPKVGEAAAFLRTTGKVRESRDSATNAYCGFRVRKRAAAESGARTRSFLSPRSHDSKARAATDFHLRLRQTVRSNGSSKFEKHGKFDAAAIQ